MTELTELKVVITINCTNDSFQGSDQLGEILRDLAVNESFHGCKPGILRDVNGNTVGGWEWEWKA